MNCPTCGAWTNVKGTRKSSIFGYIRRRECGNEHRFTTKEVVMEEDEIKETVATNNRKIKNDDRN